MLGNDVVDLRDPEARAGATHPRFDARVFAAAELAALESDRSVDTLRWELWAAKESSYKAARKLDPRIGFSPLRFEVKRKSEHESTVAHDRLRFAVRTERADGALHAVAVTEPAPDASLIRGCERVEDADPSSAARLLAITGLSAHLGIDGARITIDREGRIPIVLVDGRRSDIDLSLSHHGGVVGFAALLLRRPSA